MHISNSRLAIIGLGYVGLPLAVEFAKHRNVIGFDIDSSRIQELSIGFDRTLEVEDQLLSGENLRFTDDPSDLQQANVYIVTTPTPIDEYNKPDLGPLLQASKTIGQYLRDGDVVIYESTVYPGATEEECVPVLEYASGLKFNEGFFVGYSPERINPGDKEHRVHNIVKITSGSSEQIAKFVDELYLSIVSAGTHRASSIKVAEAAKVIENTQRDVNIALMNELAVLFNRLGIDTDEVLQAAGSKWNFLPFRPGLVGGHCIGVDPYYLTHKAQSVGYHPEIILAGRRLNDSMPQYVAAELVKAMIKNGIDLQKANVLILGITFKENTPDLRNTKVVNIIEELREYGINIDVHDPWASSETARVLYGIETIQDLPQHKYEAVVLAVAHRQYQYFSNDQIESMLASNNSVVFDLKSVWPKTLSNLRL